LSLARAQTVEAYDDVELDRLLIQAGDYLLDRFAVKATDGSTRTIDWAYHNPGNLSSDHVLAADSSLPSSEGYQHLTDVLSAGEDGNLALHWSTGLTSGTTVGSIWDNDSNTVTSFTLLNDANQSQEGSWTGQLETDFTGSASNAYSLFSLDPPEDLPEETVEGLYFWLYGDGSGVNLAARVWDDTDERFVADIGPVDWVGWREFLVSDPETWSHYQGNDDGVFDLPLSKISFQVGNGGTGTSTLLLDGISLELASGTVPYENFEQEGSGLDLVVLGETGTTLYTANGLGPSLEDVPMVLVRRSATETVYESVMAPYTGASIVEGLRRLDSDFGFAWEVDGVGWVDIVVVAERAGIGLAGEMQTDGLAARLRTDDATLAPLRADIVAGSVLAHNDALVLGSMGAVDNLSVTWSGEDLLVECASTRETELRIYGPDTNDVVVGKDSVVFRQDGDYVVLSWPAEIAVDTGEPEDTSEPEDTGEDATDTGSTGGAKTSPGGCGCATGSRPGSGGWLLGGLLAVGLVRRRRGENQQTA
jgi:MYXO-CTERM domain-containing protein